MRDGSAVQQNIVREDGAACRPAQRHQERQRFDPRRRQRVQGPCCRLPAPRRRLASRSASCSTNRYSSNRRWRACVREGAIAAALTALMILLFLGSWRSTIVVMISIPLAILTSLVALYFLGDTLNTMTLGGLALAVGILVDDLTVTIENTASAAHPRSACRFRQRRCTARPGSPCRRSSRRSPSRCVFTSVVFLEGPARYLFTPLGLAVVFAMLASYGLSRTLTPITIGLLLKGEQHGGSDEAPRNWFGRFHAAFERNFEQMRQGYVAGAPTSCSIGSSSCRSSPWPCWRSELQCSCSSDATSFRSSTAV